MTNALVTLQNNNFDNLTMPDILETVRVGTYGASAKSWPACLKEATTTKDSVETEDYALAKTPNGAKRVAMDKIIASVPKRAWESFFNETGTQNERKELKDVDLFLISKHAIKNVVSPGTAFERVLIKELVAQTIPLSNTPQNYFAQVNNIVLALKTAHKVKITDSFLTVLSRPP